MSTPTRSLAQLLAMHPLLPLAWRVATTTGRFLRDERPSSLAVDTKSTPTDPVSEMDRRAEAAIVAEVAHARPDDGFLGEEGAARPGSSGVRWIIDPLDGTVNYLLGLPQWAVSVGVESDGVAMIGVVDAPMLDETYVAVAGHGAWCVHHGVAERLEVRRVAHLGEALVSTGFSYDAEVRVQQVAVLADIIGQVRDIRRLGSAALDFCWVARGWVDAYFERDVKPWDMAAGALIAQEAGAVVTGVEGDDWTRLVLAGSPAVVESLGRLLRAPSA